MVLYEDLIEEVNRWAAGGGQTLDVRL